MSTPIAFIELVKLLRIFEARLFAWSATPCLSYPAAETYHDLQEGKQLKYNNPPTYLKYYLYS